MNQKWTGERLDELRRHAASGWIAREIAAEMGTTRNAIIGAARRSNIAVNFIRRRPVVEPAPKHRREIAKVAPIKVEVLPEVATMTLWDAGRYHCKFIIGSASDAMVCGGELSPFRRVLPYCTHHLKVSTSADWWEKNGC